MTHCKCCRSLMIGGAASQSFHNLEKLLESEGFVAKTIHDVAASLGPMCDTCLKAWAKELSSD
jgi:hypothetical protein